MPALAKYGYLLQAERSDVCMLQRICHTPMPLDGRARRICLQTQICNRLMHQHVPGWLLISSRSTQPINAECVNSERLANGIVLLLLRVLEVEHVIRMRILGRLDREHHTRCSATHPDHEAYPSVQTITVGLLLPHYALQRSGCLLCRCQSILCLQQWPSPQEAHHARSSASRDTDLSLSELGVVGYPVG